MSDESLKNFLDRVLLTQIISNKKYTPPFQIPYLKNTIFQPNLQSTISKPVLDLKSPLTKKFSPILCTQLNMRLKRKTLLLKRIREITNGLTMPDIAEVTIGSAKKMMAAVLFFDLKDFTSRAATLGNEKTLFVLNHIIPNVMYIVKRWNGEIEKNTGDGIMAIFGTETRNVYLIARDAIEAAMTIRYFMQELVPPVLSENGIQPFSFRIGIDMSDLLIARIGIDKNNFLTVVGWAANSASRLQGLAQNERIFIGNNLKNNLHPKLHRYCEERTHEDWKWVYAGTNTPYRMFAYTAVWPDSKEWIKMKF